MIGGRPEETAEEYAARRAREDALDRGEEVVWEGMTMQRREDGFYLNGEKVPEDGFLAAGTRKKRELRELEARRVPTRARETDWQRRGKGGETRAIQPPTEPISTGTGARTVTETSDPLALEYPCPVCSFVARTIGGRRNHFTRRHPRLSHPDIWPTPRARQEEPMEPKITRAEIGPRSDADILREMTSPSTAASISVGLPVAHPPTPAEERLVSEDVPPDGSAEVLKAIDEEPPWAPLYARADTLLTVVGKCAEHLIPLSQRDQAIAMRWLAELLSD